MNYFELYIGDYQKKTAHLSMLEHAAYFLMLQAFYATEKPLPPKGRILYRIVSAVSYRERKAVDSIIEQFWIETADGLVNERADIELANYRKFREKQRAAGKASAAKRAGVYLNGGSTTVITPVQPPLNSGSNQTSTLHTHTHTKNKSKRAGAPVDNSAHSELSDRLKTVSEETGSGPKKASEIAMQALRNKGLA